MPGSLILRIGSPLLFVLLAEAPCEERTGIHRADHGAAIEGAEAATVVGAGQGAGARTETCTCRSQVESDTVDSVDSSRAAAGSFYEVGIEDAVDGGWGEIL